MKKRTADSETSEKREAGRSEKADKRPSVQSATAQLRLAPDPTLTGC